MKKESTKNAYIQKIFYMNFYRYCHQKNLRPNALENMTRFYQYSPLHST